MVRNVGNSVSTLVAGAALQLALPMKNKRGSGGSLRNLIAMSSDAPAGSRGGACDCLDCAQGEPDRHLYGLVTGAAEHRAAGAAGDRV